MLLSDSIHSIVLRGSRISRAPPHHTLPALLNLNGRTFRKIFQRPRGARLQVRLMKIIQLKILLKFEISVATTIGYGSITPSTDKGKLFCIAYTIIGIPYFAYMISVMADLINRCISWLNSRIVGISITGLYIVLGTIFLIIIPAKIFIMVEGKNFTTNKFYSSLF